MFGVFLDETVQSAYVCGEQIEVFEIFTFLGSRVQNKGVSPREVLRWIGMACDVVELICTNIWCSLSAVVSGLTNYKSVGLGLNPSIGS